MTARNRWMWKVACAVSAMALVSGCGGVMENPYNFSDEEIAEAAAKARAWPSLADTERLVTDAVVRIGEAATGIAPNARFRWHRERSQGGGCPGPYAYTDGLSITTQALLSDVPIDESNWRAVLDAARAIATEAGMDQLEVLVDQAGHHDVTFFSADGNRITFGTFKAASIRGITGCRYP